MYRYVIKSGEAEFKQRLPKDIFGVEYSVVVPNYPHRY